MASIESVTGPLDPADLGTVLIHEHLRFRDNATADEFPHLYDEDALYAAGLEAANGAKGVGVKTIVEPTAMFGGRDVRFMERIARETGVQVVPCTGIYTYDYLPINWVSRSEDEMADAFVHDIEQGIQGTDIKAAFLKCAADEPGVTENVEKVHRACARASLRTGKPIMAHSHPGSRTGPEQMKVFIDEGVAPEQVQIAHTGDTDDLDYIEQVLDTGAYIGLDRYGIEMYLPTDKRNATVLALLERGHVAEDAPVDGLVRLDRLVQRADDRGPDGAGRGARVAHPAAARGDHSHAEGRRDDRRAAGHHAGGQLPGVADAGVVAASGLSMIARTRAWCKGCTRAFQALSTGSIPVARSRRRGDCCSFCSYGTCRARRSRRAGRAFRRPVDAWWACA